MREKLTVHLLFDCACACLCTTRSWLLVWRLEADFLSGVMEQDDTMSNFFLSFYA